VFQSNSLVSLYTSYSKSFDPLGINQTAPVALSPTRGTQYEAGLKLDLLRSRLQTTVSVYRIKQTGLLAGSGVTDLPSGASGSGFQINKGAELDVTGQITADWSLTAAYAFNQGELVEGPMPRPQAPLNAPKHSGTLWTTYQFQRSAFHGLRVGAGVTGVDSRRVLVTSDFRIPDYTRFDVMAAYRLKEGHWTLQLNVRDITAKTYYETTRLAAPFGLIFPMTRVIQPALRFQF
jgi:iron complex outermembrane receptor protein